MEKEEIREILQKNSNPVAAFFSGREGDPREGALSAFFQELKSMGGFFERSDRFQDLLEESPFLAFSGTGPAQNFYKAVPAGLEWPPFLSLIRFLGSGTHSLTSDSKQIIRNLKRPVTLRVLITPSCPFCAQVVGLVNQFAVAGPMITVWIIDLELFPEYVQRYHPKAAPTTILEEEVFLTGQIREKELADWVAKLDSPGYLIQLYHNDLLEKRMDQALKRLKAHPQDLPIIAGLISDEAFSVKLGTMALFEQLSDEIPELHGALFEALSPLLDDSSEQVVGDAAYLIGFLDDQRKVRRLEALLAHANPEIVEIAREGLKT
jgi:hypothetical protein